ncbi:3-phosphoinositide dependent protein kinase-1 [Coemansia sp. RSA 1358]|nr:3-phosphoinositide dependent protein kinase-1 [Coemansia sp. RSA 1358]
MTRNNLPPPAQQLHPSHSSAVEMSTVSRNSAAYDSNHSSMSNSDSSIYTNARRMHQQGSATVSELTEMRERPRIPPKPANLRSATNNNSNSFAPVSSQTALVAAEAAMAFNSTSDSPSHSLHSTTLALNAAAATPKPTPCSLVSETPSSARLSQPTQQQQQSSSTSMVTDPKPLHLSSNQSNAKQSTRKRVVSDFEFGRTLGEGSYSTVVEATEKATGRVYAAKILDKRHIIKEKKIKYVNIERDMLQALHHPFIVRLHYAFQDSQSLYFIIDIASNGELLSWIRKLGGLSEECARFYLAEIIAAVEYMHMERTLHRDIKPENILLGSDMHILVTDFGTAKMFRKDEKEMRAYSFVGTAEYVSPELLTDKAADCNSDLWAIGCIAYQLLTGRPPFKGSNEYQTFQKVLKLDFSFPPNMPPQARDLIERILVLDPEKRLGATQRGGFEELKAHPFFEGFEWQGVEMRTPPPMAGPEAVTQQQQQQQQQALELPVASTRPAPPAIPPKPAVLRQPSAVPSNTIYEARGSSSDGFGTEKTSDSFSPLESTDPLTSFAAPNLNNYQIDAPISPRQTPMHLANHARGGMIPPPPPPPPQHMHGAFATAAPSQMAMRGIMAPMAACPTTYTKQSSESADDIYNVRLNDHVPAPLQAEEMAAVQGYHGYQAHATTSDYYAAAAYRPPAASSTRPVYNTGYGGSGRSGGSWLSRLRTTLCCGASS